MCDCLSNCWKALTKRGRSRGDLYEPLLMDEERDAVSNLLQFLENRADVNFFHGDPLKALSILSYSDNVDLQRSAALTFAEVTAERFNPSASTNAGMTHSTMHSQSAPFAVDDATLEPIITLAHSSDVEVQRAASAALGNLATRDENKENIVRMGALTPLVQLLNSPNREVQCNACGCITNLATNASNKLKIAQAGALLPLIRLAGSKDLRVQRNATGALLNLTHLEINRQQLVLAGAIPMFVSFLQSRDVDVQYYCAAALSNLAVDVDNRKKIVAMDNGEVLSWLVRLTASTAAKVQCQACLALRNLASDDLNQVKIVEHGGLRALFPLLKSPHLDVVVAAVAAVRNISIHSENEVRIVTEGFLQPLADLLMTENEEIQCHAAGTLRNLAANDQNKAVIAQSAMIERLVALIAQVRTGDSVMSEVTAALAVLALHADIRDSITSIENGAVVPRLVKLTMCNNPEIQCNSAGALGNLATQPNNHSVLLNSSPSILDCIRHFISSDDPNFQHIALWTLHQLAGGESTRPLLVEAGMLPILTQFASNPEPDVRQLAEQTLQLLKTSSQ